MRFLGRLVVRILAFFGFVGLVATGVGVWLSLPPALPDQSVLWINFNHPVGSSGGGSSLGSRGAYDLYELVETIERAADDPAVTGMMAELGPLSLSLANVQEIRDAVATFRASGKPAVIFAPTFGEGNGLLPYYLATAFGHIWLQPSGEVELGPFAVEMPFVRELLEHIGAKPEFARRYEYKGAIETFVRDSMSPEQRENYTRLLNSWQQQIHLDVAKDRMLSIDDLRRLMNEMPLLPSEALQAKLVDRLGYREDALLEVAKEEVSLISVHDYRASWRAERGERVPIALIRAEGDIVSGESRSFPYDVRPPQLGSETVTRALMDAANDPDIKGVLFYIDSKGGSYGASDAIRDAVDRVQRSGKPVIAVMGGSAASGGYFSVMGAKRVVAQPGTLTGSIGIFAGKFSLAELWEKLGVRWDGIGLEESSHWSINRDMTPEDWRKLNKMLDAGYADFTAKVMMDRGISSDRIDAVARGRVWSGQDAHEQGLVDHLGGFAVARRLLRRELEVADDAWLDMRPFPVPKTVLQQILELGEGGGILSARISSEDRIILNLLKTAAPLLRAADGRIMARTPDMALR